MIKRLVKWLRHEHAMPPPKPDEPLLIIGDIHGRADLLSKALQQRNCQTILVGDYIDRGEDSATVLRTLMQTPDLICLMGNHEEMLLAFLSDPARHGPRWLTYGGLQTLASFGVSGVSEASDATRLEAARNELEPAMGAEMITWLQSRPNRWQSGNVAVVHAGADPSLAIEEQRPQTLRWGHPDFAKTPRTDGVWVVHGHTFVETPQNRAGRINVDIGAYATGRLAMVRIANGDVAFQIIS